MRNNRLCGLKSRIGQFNTPLKTLTGCLKLCARLLCVIVQCALFNILFILLNDKSNLVFVETVKKLYYAWEIAPSNIILSFISIFQIDFCFSFIIIPVVWNVTSLIGFTMYANRSISPIGYSETAPRTVKLGQTVSENVFSYKQQVAFLA